MFNIASFLFFQCFLAISGIGMSLIKPEGKFKVTVASEDDIARAEITSVSFKIFAVK